MLRSHKRRCQLSVLWLQTESPSSRIHTPSYVYKKDGKAHPTHSVLTSLLVLLPRPFHSDGSGSGCPVVVHMRLFADEIKIVKQGTKGRFSQ